METDELIDPAPILPQEPQPHILITSPVFIKETLTKCVAYTIQGQDSDGPIEIRKTFNDFKKLRLKIISVWGGTYIPPLPRRKFIGEFDPIFIEERRKILEKFMQQCIKLKHIYCWPIFQQFLRSAAPLDVGPTVIGVIKDLLETTFPKFIGLSANPEHKGLLFHAIKNFDMALSELRVFKKFVDKTCGQLFKYQKSVNHFMDAFNILAGVYMCKKSFGQTRDLLLNPYWALQDWVNSEILDTEAIVESINCLYTYDAAVTKLQEKCQDQAAVLKSLSEGKKPLMALFKDKEKVFEEYSTALNSMTAELDATEAVRNLLYHHMIDEEIFKFISQKSSVFHACLREYINQNTEEFEHQLSLITLLSSNFNNSV